MACSAGSKCFSESRWWMGSVISISWVVAGVVSTWMSRWGRFSSQVSVRCTDVPGPDRAAFDAEMGFWIIGRGNQDRGRRNILVGAKAEHTVIHPKLLQPDPPQALHRWHLRQPRRRISACDRGKSRPTIGPNLLRQGLARAALLWESDTLRFVSHSARTIRQEPGNAATAEPR